MTTAQVLILLAAGTATVLTRALPFLVFRSGNLPPLVRYLGDALPGAVFAFLVVYCVKDVSWTSGTHGIPEVAGILAAGGLYAWRRNMLLSIFAATALYMLLVNVVLV